MVGTRREDDARKVQVASVTTVETAMIPTIERIVHAVADPEAATASSAALVPWGTRGLPRSGIAPRYSLTDLVGSSSRRRKTRTVSFTKSRGRS
jgi:hypothetical protein